jgi:hypothetical protein
MIKGIGCYKPFSDSYLKVTFYPTISDDGKKDNYLNGKLSGLGIDKN